MTSSSVPSVPLSLEEDQAYSIRPVHLASPLRPAEPRPRHLRESYHCFCSFPFGAGTEQDGGTACFKPHYHGKALGSLASLTPAGPHYRLDGLSPRQEQETFPCGCPKSGVFTLAQWSEPKCSVLRTSFTTEAPWNYSPLLTFLLSGIPDLLACPCPATLAVGGQPQKIITKS